MVHRDAGHGEVIGLGEEITVPYQKMSITMLKINECDLKLKEKLEFCMDSGNIFVIVGVEDEIDPMLDPVMEKRKLQAKTTMIDFTVMLFSVCQEAVHCSNYVYIDDLEAWKSYYLRAKSENRGTEIKNSWSRKSKMMSNTCYKHR